MRCSRPWVFGRGVRCQFTCISLPLHESHAHSVFIVALFLWYWEGTRASRTLRQWLLLGLISGLLVDVYFVNGGFFVNSLCPGVHLGLRKVTCGRKRIRAAILPRFGAEMYCTLAAFGIMIVPTLITRKIVFGGMLTFGAYTVLPWNWHAPFWYSVLFSSDHGLLSWTPLLGFALLGLFLPFCTKGKPVKAYLALPATVAFYYVISQLSLLGWFVIVRKSFFNFSDACICFWTGGAARSHRRDFPLLPVCA